MSKPVLFSIIVCLVLGLRALQAEKRFAEQRKVFPASQKGVFRAWVSEEPEVLFKHQVGSHDTGRLAGSYQPFVREVRAVCTILSYGGNPIAPVKSRCTLRLSPQASQPVLSYGDLLEIEGKIQAPQPAMNPGQFDYAHYLKTKGVAYVMYVAPGKWRKVEPPEIATSPNAPTLRGPQSPEQSRRVGAAPRNDSNLYGWRFLRWSCGLKRWAEDILYRDLSFPENALLDGILLGERTPLPEEMVQSFFLTGTIHILAVSGLMTAYVAGLLFMVLRVMRFKRKWAAGAALVGLVFFVFMTGANPPVCRAGLFSGLALVAVLLERRIHGGVLLAVTAITLVLVNPFALVDLSFQISFLATAGLMVICPWLMEKLSFLWRPAALLVTTTTAAQLAVWVLILYDFNQFSLYSILSNLVIVPLALFSTAAGLTLLAGALIHPALGRLFGAACEAPLRLLEILADWMGKWPNAELIVASPPLAWVLLFHGLLLFSFLVFWPSPPPEKPSEKWKRKKEMFARGRRWALRAWVLFTLGTGVALLVSALRPQPLRAVFLSVGHGNAVVLESPGGKILVVDGGRESFGFDRYNPVVAYLRHIGVRRVEGVIDTHPDADHVGGLVNVVSAYPVSEGFEGFSAKAQSGVYLRFKERLRERGVPLLPLKEGDPLPILDLVHLELLHPAESYHPRIHADNNLSVVTLASFGTFNLVLPGDLEREGLLRLFRGHRPFPKVDWLLAPHHGRESGEPSLCAEGFHPRFVVLSDWRDYSRARDQYQAVVPDAVVLSTAEEGAIEVEMNKDGSGRYRSFRHRDWKGFQGKNFR